MSGAKMLGAAMAPLSWVGIVRVGLGQFALGHAADIRDAIDHQAIAMAADIGDDRQVALVGRGRAPMNQGGDIDDRQHPAPHG